MLTSRSLACTYVGARMSRMYTPHAYIVLSQRLRKTSGSTGRLRCYVGQALLRFGCGENFDCVCAFDDARFGCGL
jgi:hypothetical protein